LMFPQYLPNRIAPATRASIAWRPNAQPGCDGFGRLERDILRFASTRSPTDRRVIYNAYDDRFGVEPREEDVIRA
jgi:hypothetical protein